ncbi:hypothetical protein P8452_51527 [Trifolium repens]|nr:hypothetical protein P8452_33346 [Trifolium repens]WJX67028.1 hypothetical protein P8452_51527 [Trifolium repens]
MQSVAFMGVSAAVSFSLSLILCHELAHHHRITPSPPQPLVFKKEWAKSSFRKHEIDDELGTPIRDHIKFPIVKEKIKPATKEVLNMNNAKIMVLFLRCFLLM